MMTTLPPDWHSVMFRDCLAELSGPRLRKIAARDYAQEGAFPIVDQGQKFIAGYTDDADAVIRTGLPYVIFGDHTRIFKFVDFPFAIGADGTQLLKPNGSFDPRFFAFACQNLEIPNRGYNRHFVLVKEMPMSTDTTEFKGLVQVWAERLRVAPSQIRVQKMPRKWASCSRRGWVTFSVDLLDMPRPFQDYVIIHELLHLRIRNHGKLFHATLRSLLSARRIAFLNSPLAFNRLMNSSGSK